MFYIYVACCKTNVPDHTFWNCVRKVIYVFFVKMLPVYFNDIVNDCNTYDSYDNG